MGEQTTIFDIIENEDTFDFEEMKQNLIDNLDMLKEMSVQEQTLYKKWQEMKKYSKEKRLLEKHKHSNAIMLDLKELTKCHYDLLKKYQKLFEMENVKLSFTKDALLNIADHSIKKKNWR